ncbi:uncharacterized, partial [Tachysurus ichikawai]
GQFPLVPFGLQTLRRSEGKSARRGKAGWYDEFEVISSGSLWVG